MRNLWCMVLVFCALATVANAAVIIYQEDFDGPEEELLNGRAPTIAPPDVTWVAGSDFKADGAVVWDGVPFGASAYLPFSPQDGYVYELSVDMVMTTSDTGNDWAAMGFTEFNTEPESRFFNDNGERNPRYWMLSRVITATQNDQTFIGAGTGGAEEAPTRSANDLRIVLNTGAPTWTVSWYFDGTLVRTVDVAEENKTLLNYVALSTNRTTGTISSFKLTAIPLVPWNPTPADGAVGVFPDVAFSWNKARSELSPQEPNELIVEHRLTYVTYSIDDVPAEPNIVGPGSVQVIVPDSDDPIRYPAEGELSLTTDLRVFWRVEHLLSNGGTAVGDVWEFSTRRSAPEIVADLENVNVFEGQSATFSVEFESYSAVLPKWLKVVENGEDLVISEDPWHVLDEAKYSVDTDMLTYATLTIHDVDASDAGFYYCVLPSSGGQVTTRIAGLHLNELVAHYPFENHFDDVLGGPSGIPMSNDANHPTVEFVPGIAGQHAVYLWAAPEVNNRGQYIDFGTEGFPKAGLGNGLETGTISMWIRPERVGMLLCNFNDNIRQTPEETGTGTTGFGFSLETPAQTRMVVRGEPIDDSYYEMGTIQAGTENLIDQQWHHVVTTWKAGGDMTLYIDGLEIASIEAGTPETYFDWQYGVLLGTSRPSADRTALTNFYRGAIDDLRIYNYAKDQYGVAGLYYEVTGIRPCIDEYASEFDFNGDCVVDIRDFAEFARHWLDSGLYQPQD